MKTHLKCFLLLPVLIAALGLLPAGAAEVADLSLRGSSSWESNLIYSVTVSNAGPSVATGVVVSTQVYTNYPFISATGGATPTNGVLLVPVGSLAVGATNVVQIVVTKPASINLLWHPFQVFADQTDPNPTNNSYIVWSISNPTITYTTSTVTQETNLTATVNRQVNEYSTELIARLPNGTVVYDQTFNAAYSDPAVQAAVAQAAAALAGAGAASYTGPTETNSSQTLVNSASVTATNAIGTNVSAATTMYIGPQTIMVGENQSQVFTLSAGQVDYDTLITFVVTNLVTTTNTDTYLNSAAYVMEGVLGQADLSLSIFLRSPEVTGGELDFFITVSNAGPSVASGVVVSNQIPTNTTFVSATGGATPTNGVLRVNLGSLAVGATNLVELVVTKPATPFWTFNYAFQLFADQTDPVPTNNYASYDYRQIIAYTTSTVTQETNLTATVNRQVNEYSTELIARLPNGAVVFDQTFNAAYSDPAVQAAVAQAAAALTNAGAASYTGPTETNSSQTLVNSASVTATNAIGTNVSAATTEYIGPQTIMVGENQSEVFTLAPGQHDYDTLITFVVTNLVTTTNTSTYLNSAAYVMTGVVGQADLSLSAHKIVLGVTNDVWDFSVTVSNAGPSAATGVVVSNQIPANATFISATGGATPTNGVLLVNLGSLAVGATDSIQIVVVRPSNFVVTNVFQVFANQTDPDPTNNYATVLAQNTINYTTSTATHETNLTATVNQRVNEYSTELIARLPNGTVVYDQTFNAAYSNSTVQAAVAQAAAALAGAGATSYTGPTMTNASQTLVNSASVTATNVIGTGVSAATTMYVGPQTIMVGDFQSVALTLLAGAVDYDTLITSVVTNLVTTTNTDTYLNSAAYVMEGVLGQADLSLSASVSWESNTGNSNLLFSLTISNAGPSAATGVVISNQIPTNTTFISATGGATPTNGVLLVNLGSLAAGAASPAQVVVQVPPEIDYIRSPFFEVFQVFADQTDPNLTNNSVSVFCLVNGSNLTISTVTNQTNLTATVNQRVNEYSTELIARLPNGTVVFDQTFNAAFSDPTVQAAVTQAAAALTNAGAASHTGPTETSASQTLVNSSSVTATNAIGTNVFAATTTYIGPTNLMTGNNQSQYTVLPAGVVDYDTLLTAVVTNLVTTTTTDTYLNSAAYVMTGVVLGQADLSLSAFILPRGDPYSNMVISGTVSNAGPSAATGVVVSNVISGAFAFISATGGATPTNGVLLVSLGSLAVGATNSVRIELAITESPFYSVNCASQVFADQTDPNLTNNSTYVSAGMVSAITTSTVTHETNLTATVNQQATNYSTELIAKLPNGTVVFDQTFNAAYSDPAVQAAVAQAAAALTNAGAASYTGPMETNASQTLVNSASVTATNAIGTNVSVATTKYIGPTNIMVGENQSQPFTIPTGCVDDDTLITSVVTNLVTTTNTATYLNSAAYVMEGIVAQVDVALSLTAAPNPVDVGAPLTYSLTVTNNSSTPATGVVVSNTLPANVSVISVLPSQGSASNSTGVVTYSVGSLSNGTAATLAIVVVPNAAGLLTNAASAFSAQTDSQPANNRVTNVTTAVSVPVTNLALTVLSSIALNPQTGLFEQRIRVSNGGPATPSSVRVLISGLAANARLYNATGTTNGTPFVQSASPLGVGSNVVFLLEYYVPTRVATTNLTLAVEAGPLVIPPVVNGTTLNINRTVVQADGSVLVEFSAVPGQIYAVQYSSDMVTWQTAVPAITAPATRVQWIDSGPPKTDSSPAQQSARYYRVVLLPAN